MKRSVAVILMIVLGLASVALLALVGQGTIGTSDSNSATYIPQSLAASVTYGERHTPTG